MSLCSAPPIRSIVPRQPVSRWGSAVTVSTIADLPSVGEDFGAVHAEVERDGVTQQRDYVAWRDGTLVTVLIAYGATDLPTHAELAEIITAIAGR